MLKSPEIRITSGKFRGRVLKSPASSQTHPMGAREKLALFNMVNVENATVLDAFAGSGALGIEALSRGAKEVIFVESSPKIAQTIHGNLELIGVASTRGIEVEVVDIEDSVLQNGFEALKTSIDPPKTAVWTQKVADFAEVPQFCHYFDAILADPPYDKINIDELNKLPKLLKSDGVLALSSPAKMPVVELDDTRLSSTHVYAGARITIYRKG